MLPVKDGVTCCKELREFSDIPIIMLTAKISEIDRIIGLEAGAHDYVCKPSRIFSRQQITFSMAGVLFFFTLFKPNIHTTNRH